MANAADRNCRRRRARGAVLVLCALGASCGPRAAPGPATAAVAGGRAAGAPRAPEDEVRTATASTSRAPAPPAFAAELRLDGESWVVRYTFAEPQTALLFDTQHGDYRATHWEVLDVGAELAALDGLDGLFFAAPAREVSLRVRPPSAAVAGTPPFLRFSDGSRAFYGGQLALLTVESRAAAEALRGDLRRWRGQQPPVVVRFVAADAGLSVLADRPGREGAVTVTAHRGIGPYIYAGPLGARGGALLDPGLPAWLLGRVEADLGAVDQALARRWGRALEPATYLLAWEGASAEWSNTGRAEGLQIAMSIRGARYLEPDDDALADLLWFFAHERAHHFQHARGVRIDPFPLEGAADAMATVVLGDLGLFDARALARRDERVRFFCGRALARGPIDRQGGGDAQACGELVSRATARALAHGDLFRFWTQLLEDAARQGARVDASFYLYFLRRSGADPQAVDAIERFIAGPHAEPEAAMRALGP